MSYSESSMISIIIPVLHETKIINQLIHHLHQLKTTDTFEIIVVDGSPEEDTLAVINDTAVIKIKSKQGRGIQMNTGAAIAQGDILMFLHADTFLPDKAFIILKETLKDDRYVGGAFSFGVETKNIWIKIIAALSWFRCQITKIPYGDQAIFLRKKYFEEIKGYAEIPLMEDLELMIRIKKNRGKIILLPDRISTSPRRWETEGALYAFVRDVIIIVLYYLGVSPGKLERWYPWQEKNS